MAIRVAINHRTSYKYDRFVSLSPHIFRLRPAVHSRTPIESYSFKVTPKDHFINWQQDPFGNYQARVVFPEKTNELTIEVEVIANMIVINPFEIKPVDITISDFYTKTTFPFRAVGRDGARDDFASGQLPHHVLSVFEREFDNT